MMPQINNRLASLLYRRSDPVAPRRRWLSGITTVEALLFLLTTAVTGPVDPAIADNGSAHICGFRLLQLESEEIAAARVGDPDASVAAAKTLTPADVGEATQDLPEIAVGTELSFHSAFNFGLIPATCRYVGEHVFVFVENRQWDTEGGSIFQSHVDGLGELFERQTPADPDRGIFDLSIEAFGEPPDVDGYEQIFLLLFDIPDSRVVGFFDPGVSTHDVPELRRDVVYLDESSVRRSSYLARGTLAHEFQHLIHWGHDQDESSWVDEGLAGYAEELAGFPEADPAAVPDFLERPWRTGLGLGKWEDTTYNYGSTFLFMSFLAERYGLDLVRQVVSEPRNGRDGIDAAFARLSLDGGFVEAWQRWVVANYAVDNEVLAYAALRGHRATAFVIGTLPLPPVNAEVASRWGTTYIVFRTPGNIQIDFDGEEVSRFSVWSYAMRAGGGELEQVKLDGENRGVVTATDIDSLVLVVGRTSLQGEGKFELSARELVVTAVAALAPHGSGGELHLDSVFPNPFNGEIHIPFRLDEDSEVEMRVYNAAGQQLLIRRLGPISGGVRETVWDGRGGDGVSAASGRYLILLKAGESIQTTSLTLVR
jgi:hypothetical protein